MKNPLKYNVETGEIFGIDDTNINDAVLVFLELGIMALDKTKTPAATGDL